MLTADWRGNPATAIDAQHPDRLAWTVDNQVRVHVAGAAYFARLYPAALGARGW